MPAKAPLVCCVFIPRNVPRTAPYWSITPTKMELQSKGAALLEEAANRLDPFNNADHKELYGRIREYQKDHEQLVNKAAVIHQLKERIDYYAGWMKHYSGADDKEHELISATGSFIALQYVLNKLDLHSRKRREENAALIRKLLPNLFDDEFRSQITT